jgi:GTP 3',8-cyclase
MLDALQRPLKTLRISVTDRCNLRCQYCMPENHYSWLAQESLLSFDETTQLARTFVSVGVDSIRLTGGEPLLRPRIHELVEKLSAIPGLNKLALTTNGTKLADLASALKGAGLHEITVSLDTLNANTFMALTTRNDFQNVVRGIEAAASIGILKKIDCVVLRGTNEREIVSLLAFAQEHRAEIRFIEYMDVGGATKWNANQVVSRSEMLAFIEKDFGPVFPVGQRGSAPAERFRLASGQVFGIIASTTTPFCRSCDRARITADGTFFNCLYAKHGVDLRSALRSNASVHELISKHWKARFDTGAETRLLLNEKRAALFSAEQLKNHPHNEMHTRGG